MEDKAIRLQENLQKFIKHVDTLEREDNPAGNGFNREYRTLREEANDAKANNIYPATVGRQPFNIRKNRYKDIIAYDDTRVILETIDDHEGSDYINANYIQNFNDTSTNGYIASQGPLPNTVNDFWRMLLQEKVKCIIMVCKEMEGGKKKCAPYWPECEGGDEDFGEVKVTLEKEDFLADDCTVRNLKAEYNNTTSRLTQYHYTGWPDHGIPDDVDVILAMISNMREIRARDKDKAPIVIHCSAGCGRTGTVCAIDYSWDILKNGHLTENFSLFEIVQQMRTQRQSIIQTPDQYQLAHEAVKLLFNNHLEIMEENIYVNYDLEERKESDEKANEDDADDGIYSMATAKKIMAKEAVEAVNLYTSDNYEVVHLTKTVKPKKEGYINTAAIVFSSENDTSKKESYENILLTDKYENVEVASSPEVSHKTRPKSKLDSDSGSPRSSPKFSPKQSRKSVNEDSGPTFTQEGPLFVSKGNASPVSKPRPTGNQPLSKSLGPSTAAKSGFVSVISVGQSFEKDDAKITYHDNRPQPIATSTREEVPDNTYSLANSQATPPEGPVFASNTGPSNDIYAAVSKGKTPQKPQINVSNSSRLYAEVDISPPPQQARKSGIPMNSQILGGRSDYEEVVIGSPGDDDATYSLAHEPAVPARNYRDPEPVQQTRSHHEPPEEKGFLALTKNKVINTLKKSSGTQEQVDTSNIPGFTQRLDKKVSGPKEQPKVWKKFFKSK